MKTVKKKVSYAALFRKNLKEESKYNTEIGNIYRCLFALIPDEQLETELKYLHTLSKGKDSYFKAVGKTDWFAIWHKSVRQCDYIQNCTQERTVKLLTDKEMEELKFLRHKFSVLKASKESTEKGQLFNPEYNRYLDLWQRHRREDLRESIGGYMDSILHSTVYIDKKDVLITTFKQTFEDYERS